jgi:hypothetical protein
VSAACWFIMTKKYKMMREKQFWVAGLILDLLVLSLGKV